MGSGIDILSSMIPTHNLISPTAKLVVHLRAGSDIPYSKAIDEFFEAEKVVEENFWKR